MRLRRCGRTKTTSYIDDLQWLDAATLELLEHIVTQQEVNHLLIVGAYRDKEVNPAHPLMRTVDSIRRAGASMREIVLGPLGLNDLGSLVADALHCDQDSAWPLAQLVHAKSGGNPFFAIQFLTALAEEGLLTFDLRAAAWTWDLTRIGSKSYTDNVVDLMAGKLDCLPQTTQEALGKLACLGNSAEIATLALIHGEPEEEINRTLWRPFALDSYSGWIALTRSYTTASGKPPMRSSPKVNGRPYTSGSADCSRLRQDPRRFRRRSLRLSINSIAELR
jgi:predicted ATPase